MSTAISHEHAFLHEAFLYANDEEFLQGTLAFIREGVERGEPVLVVLNAAKIERLRAALGGDADKVSFADMAEVGANPARIIAAWREFVDENESLPIRGIGEPIWASRSADELSECHRHEELLNVAFADASGFRLLCPYDVSALGGHVIEEAQRTHPFVSDSESLRESGHYRGLEAISEPFAEPLDDPPADAGELAFDADSLGDVRSRVSEHAQQAGLSPTRAHNLVLAANEIASNSVRHGGGAGVLRVWEDDDAVICQVDDRGRIADPLIGRVRPVLEEPGGRGVWMANQLCDLVQVRTFEDGSTVRIHMARG
jgi:anti-sigma regulatory factor (Ser/Thr protein kinase)